VVGDGGEEEQGRVTKVKEAPSEGGVHANSLSHDGAVQTTTLCGIKTRPARSLCTPAARILSLIAGTTRPASPYVPTKSAA
jgi:hypothetical protein